MMGSGAMEDKKLHSGVSQDEQKIRELIKRWAKAVREKAVREEDRAAIGADHDNDILMFDVPPPFLSRGLDA
jgi:ketosteroid isomerase-like protein